MYLRVSQINGCAFCLEMHTAALRKRGMVQEKLDALAGWRVSERFSDRERAALEWTEAVTLLSAQNTDDATWQRVKAHFLMRK